MVSPLMVTLPLAGLRKPMMALKSVDLPLPFTPTSAQMEPACRRKLASWTATVPLL